MPKANNSKAIALIEGEVEHLEGKINASYDSIDRANRVADHCGTDIPADTYTKLMEDEAAKRIAYQEDINALNNTLVVLTTL